MALIRRSLLVPLSALSFPPRARAHVRSFPSFSPCDWILLRFRAATYPVEELLSARGTDNEKLLFHYYRATYSAASYDVTASQQGSVRLSVASELLCVSDTCRREVLRALNRPSTPKAPAPVVPRVD